MFDKMGWAKIYRFDKFEKCKKNKLQYIKPD